MEWNSPPLEITIENLTINIAMPPQTSPTGSGDLGAIKEYLETIMATIADLQTDVQNETTVDQSAITLINGLAAQLAAAIASGDPAALETLHQAMVANASALSAALTANTPSAPAA